VALLVAPIVTNVTRALSFPPPKNPGDARPPQPLTVDTDVALLHAQEVRLLIGGLEVARRTPAAAPTRQAVFDVPELPPGAYKVRLRVDGIDSLPVVNAGQLAIGKEVTVSHA
jgi:hypothetical protein